MNDKSAVLAGSFGGAIWLRVIGRGTFQTSAGLKRYCKDMIDRGQRKFVIDLSQCELMDSTFMGAITGIALTLRDKSGHCSLEVIHANDRNASLLHNLGLDQLFTVRKIGDPNSPQLPEPSQPMQQLTQPPSGPDTSHILDAHKALIQADESNAYRFRDVLELLEKEEKEKKNN
ncbi:MAG: STAS domain-containing protein [Chthoniobacterales bacterium]|nr:STAS domain-containing protein [Chthoniobacterales bacterium]